MSGQVVHQPPRRHHCHPGWKDVPLPENDYLREHGYASQSVPDSSFNAAPGTLWLCDCGRVWVARRNVPGNLYAHWVPERWYARWWRQRRAKRRDA